MRRASTRTILVGCLLESLLGCLLGSLGAVAGGCSSSEPGNGTNTGGRTGSNTGGATSTGGRAGTGNGSGGAVGAGTGGATATGGAATGGVGRGGASATGGRAAGGITGTGGAGMPGTGGGGGATTANCTFTVMPSTSTRIPTVGIITWSTTLANVQSARIEFGLTTAYGMTAPVDLTAPSFRTLLLGMKAARTYHFRIVAAGGAGQCTSPDNSITTGALANGLPTITATTRNAAALSGGFLITGQYVQNAGTSGAPAYILDADNQIVWWFSIGSDVTGARMSYDGKYMWINKANVPSGTANVHRVTMDGLTDENLSTQFTGQNHQLTVLPDDTVAFYAYGANGCDDIKERAPDGTVKTIVNSRTATGTTGGCHVNTVQYSAMDDTLIFSDLDHDNITKVTRTGTTVWVLGGTTSQFGTNLWTGGQHGVDILGLDRLLIFNNATNATGSMAIEFMLTLTGTKTATRTFTYTANPRITNMVMGDVQRLDNGNTIVAYSTQGVLHEVDASGALVQELTWPLGASFGYIEKRATLYGPPPK
jgi:hypothetical protein